MKKSILLLTAILLSVASANAVEWQTVETNIPNFNLFVDNDSIQVDDNGNYLYAIKYFFTGEKQKVAFIKSSSDNYIGIIEAGDFEESNYRPKAVFSTPHVFMKPINDNSFLTFSHKYILNSADSDYKTAEKPATELNKKTSENKHENNIIPAKYEKKNYGNQNYTNMKDFVSTVGQSLNSNWQPPVSGKNTQAIVIISIGGDGSLSEYRFAKSSGDEMTDRSIVSAIKQTVPFPKMHNMNVNEKNYNFQFVFEYKTFKKSVL